MARYIDADALVRQMTLQANRTMLGEITPPNLSYSEMMEIIADAPTADVVPKSEVAKIFEEVEKIRANEIHKCETLREKEVDSSERKYWEGGEHSLRQLSYWLAELKKKYTEDQK